MKRRSQRTEIFKKVQRAGQGAWLGTHVLPCGSCACCAPRGISHPHLGNVSLLLPLLLRVLLVWFMVGPIKRAALKKKQLYVSAISWYSKVTWAPPPAADGSLFSHHRTSKVEAKSISPLLRGTPGAIWAVSCRTAAPSSAPRSLSFR